LIVTVKIDLHVHSIYSGDNDSDPEECVCKALRLNLDGIAFTEHYSYAASEPVEMLREKYRDRIMIFRGVEFSAAEGHCLIFGVDTDKLFIKHHPAEEIVRVVSHSGGVVIPSHPFRRGTGMGDSLSGLPGICAVEGYNGCNLHNFNAKAIETAEALHLPFTGGSDAHTPEEVGSCYTEFYDAVTRNHFIDALKTGNYRGVDTRKISRALTA
jgi:predicted metal-dependent phosphoesterase TrpH